MSTQNTETPRMLEVKESKNHTRHTSEYNNGRKNQKPNKKKRVQMLSIISYEKCETHMLAIVFGSSRAYLPGFFLPSVRLFDVELSLGSYVLAEVIAFSLLRCVSFRFGISV